jgi:predicted ATPase/DNA-binding SARP family transcriptional activator
MRFSVLGPVEAARDGVRVRIGSRMQRRLLALLLVHGGASVDVERVIDVLWAGEPPPSAPKGLHAYVSRLRAALGEDPPLESDAHGYRLVLDEHEVDARRFERLMVAARARLGDDAPGAAAAFGEALALWRGPAYGEFAHEEFARPEAVRLEELRLTVTEDAFAARLLCHDAGVVGDLEAFTAEHPLRERPHGQLMTALARAGRQSDALEVLRRLRARLADELGLEPSPMFARLETDILQQSPEVMPPPAAAGSDAGGPRHADTWPRSAGPQRPGNLPEPVTSFVGRGHQTEVVSGLLERCRLVTLTGPGGVGKTRLAQHMAGAVVDRHPDGVWWCELAPADAEAVGHTVADVLGARPRADGSITDAILGALVGRELLLVLDNCEHVAEASARLVEHVLRRCPSVTLLATSREPLATDGEQVWHVPPLPTDPVGDEAPAVRLFTDRASAHRADFRAGASTVDAVAEICRQLDGLPLAIELAAALVPALQPSEIARRLGQRFELLTRGSRTVPRHRSLAAVVEWSYGLLDEPERRLFERLAVFSGGFTLAAVEGVCAGDQQEAVQVAGSLAELVRRSMVEVDPRVQPPRYRLLETLRHYAAERLADREEEPALRARHAAWFVDLAERADIEVRGPGEAGGVALLEAELANLRAAHRWAITHGDADLALRLATALYVFAIFRLRAEVFEWAEEAARLPTAADHPLQPTVLGAVAIGISNRGELDRTRQLAERALTAAQRTGRSTFPALAALWSASIYEGRLAEHREHARIARDVACREGDAYERVWAQVHGVLSLAYGDDREAAVEAALAGLAAADELGNPGHRAWARYVYAEALGDDDPEGALELLAGALAVAEPVADRFLEGVARVGIATLRARHHPPRDALRAFPEVIRHWRRAGDWTHQWTTLRNLVVLLVDLGADELAAQLYGAQRTADTGAYGADAARLADARDTLSDRLGPACFDVLVEVGGRLDGPGAVDVALSGIAELVDDAPAAGSGHSAHVANDPDHEHR